MNDQRVQLMCAGPSHHPARARACWSIDDTGDRKDGTATAARGPPISRLGRQDRQRHRCRDQPVGGRVLLLAGARRALYPSGSRLAGRRPGSWCSGPSRSWPSSWSTPPARPSIRVPGRGRRLFLWRQSQASPRRLAPPRSRSCWPSSPARAPGRRPTERTPRLRPPATSAGSGSTRPGRWRRVTRHFRDGHTETWWAADAQLGGWGPGPGACGWWWPAPTLAGLPGHSTWYLLTNLPRPVPPPRPAGRPGRDRAPVRAAQLGRAGLQAGQRRARLGRLPGPLRPGHPPALGAGLLRVLVLLAGLLRRPSLTQPAAPDPPGRPRRPRGGQRRPDIRAEPAVQACRGRWRYERCGPGWSRGACWRAAGERGRQRRRPGRYNGCLTGLPQAGRSTSIIATVINKLPLTGPGCRVEGGETRVGGLLDGE